jgi:uncharacterized membrane protein YedE/YeeE
MTLASDIQIVQGLIGGVLIGFSALLLFIGKGKVAGISGIVGNAVSHPKESAWRWFFMAGLLSGAAMYLMVNGSLDVTLPSFDMRLALAALFVGVGTRIGSGCTSGHGVCGIGRGSARSVVATGIFMAVAIITVLLGGR